MHSDDQKVIEDALDTAVQLAEVASDWNLDEVEINGEMVSIYDVIDQLRNALALVRQPEE